MKKELKQTRGIFQKPGSDAWWIRFVDASGRYRREKAGTRGAAEKLYHKRKQEALEGRKLPETLRRRTVTFSEIADDALRYSKQHKRSYTDDVWRMAKLKEWFGSREAESLESQQIEKRLSEAAKERKWTPGSYNKYRSLMMMVYREARRAGKVNVNPARDVKHWRESNGRVRFLSRGENGEYVRLVKAIRERTPEHLPDFIFALHTGLRLTNQFTATHAMIDWTRNVLDVPRTKNDEPVHIPLNETVLAAIRSLPSWRERKGYLFRNQQHPEKRVLATEHWFTPALKAAGIENFRWHDLRHSFASWLVQDGVPLNRVSELLGHKSLQMTMRYAHLAPGQLHSDVALLVTNSTPVALKAEPEETDAAKYIN